MFLCLIFHKTNLIFNSSWHLWHWIENPAIYHVAIEKVRPWKYNTDYLILPEFIKLKGGNWVLKGEGSGQP